MIFLLMGVVCLQVEPAFRLVVLVLRSLIVFVLEVISRLFGLLFSPFLLVAMLLMGLDFSKILSLSLKIIKFQKTQKTD